MIEARNSILNLCGLGTAGAVFFLMPGAYQLYYATGLEEIFFPFVGFMVGLLLVSAFIYGFLDRRTQLRIDDNGIYSRKLADINISWPEIEGYAVTSKYLRIAINKSFYAKLNETGRSKLVDNVDGDLSLSINIRELNCSKKQVIKLLECHIDRISTAKQA